LSTLGHQSKAAAAAAAAALRTIAQRPTGAWHITRGACVGHGSVCPPARLEVGLHGGGGTAARHAIVRAPGATTAAPTPPTPWARRNHCIVGRTIDVCQLSLMVSDLSADRESTYLHTRTDALQTVSRLHRSNCRRR